MGDRAAKDRLFEALASTARALGAGRRAEIVDVLTQGERSVEELAGEIGQSVANTSHHLKALAAAGLVSSRRVGNRVFYAVASPLVEQAWVALRAVAAVQVGQFDKLAADYLGDRGALVAVSREELLQRAGAVVILDVRPLAEYTAGHIPGALPADPRNMADLLDGLPEGPVVAYCRGDLCVFADDAVRL
jgi:DNA-binding transcriptional ArsR family regulator